eukprot:1894068-Prymnesium_polylepis.2
MVLVVVVVMPHSSRPVSPSQTELGSGGFNATEGPTAEGVALASTLPLSRRVQPKDGTPPLQDESNPKMATLSRRVQPKDGNPRANPQLGVRAVHRTRQPRVQPKYGNPPPPLSYTQELPNGPFSRVQPAHTPELD